MRIKGKKVCNFCKIEKSTEEFHQHPNGKLGVTTKCKMCISGYNQKYYTNHPNREKRLQDMKEYRESHKKERNENHHKRIKKDPLYKLSLALRTTIHNSLKAKEFKKPLKSELIIGCSFKEFKDYIESLFEPWMNWNNYGNWNGIPKELNTAWDLDHIIPTSTAKTEEDIIRLNHYTNLRPFCAYTNRFIKKDKILP